MSSRLSFLLTPVELANSARKAVLACTWDKYPSALEWNPPEPIVYRTPLGAAQLNARRIAGNGELSYRLTVGGVVRPDNSVVLEPGLHDIEARLSGTYTYFPTAVRRTVTVLRRPVNFTWKPKRDGLAVGDPFTADRIMYTASDSLDGSAVPGTVRFSVRWDGRPTDRLRAGKNVVTATFTPVDQVHFVCTDNELDAEISLQKVKPDVKFTGPPTIAFADYLPDDAVTAVATYKGAAVPGTCKITSVLDTYKLTGDGGPPTRYTVEFTPVDSGQFVNVSQSLDIRVIKAVATVEWSDPASIVYGTLLSDRELNLTCSVKPKRLVYNHGVQKLLGGGDHLLTATVTLPEGYEPLPQQTVTLTVTPAEPIIEWTPEPTNPQATLGAAQLNATASFRRVDSGKRTVTELVHGVFSYAPGPGAATNAAPGEQVLKLTFTPADRKCFSVVNASAPLTLRWATENQIRSARLSDAMREKVLRGLFTNDGSLVGAHSSGIVGAPGYTCTPLGVNGNGTRRYNVQKRKPDGTLSAAKFSTLPPANWDDDAFLYATVRASSALGTAPDDEGRTTHSMLVPHPATGVSLPWEVVKNDAGEIIASYPTA